MNRTLNRIFCSLAALLVSMAAFAQYVYPTIDGLAYSLNTSTKNAQVYYNTDVEVADLVIPATVTYNGETYTVTELIGGAFKANTSSRPSPSPRP